MYFGSHNAQYGERCFYAVGSGITFATITLIPFVIPRDARFISFFIIGPGSGGGGGIAGTAGTSRNGGGGGGPGTHMTAIYSTRSLPQLVYLFLPGGGTGGAGGAAATNGTVSVPAFVSVSPPTSATPVINNNIAYGGAGAAPSGTTGGATGTPPSVATQRHTSFALSFNPSTTLSGSNAGSPGVDLEARYIVTGGTGGGNVATATPSNGGNIITSFASNIHSTNSASTNLVPGGLSAGGVNGTDGTTNILDSIPYGSPTTPYYSLGGTGGASSNAGQGGNGGHGAIGCGGGGGGAGVTGQAGAGGNGGPSFILIEWW